MNNKAAAMFPADTCEALAMLYVQSQDLSHKTPKEIYNMYSSAYHEMKKMHDERAVIKNTPR